MKTVNKPRLAIDMDDVIADSMTLILNKYNKEYNTNLSKNDLHGKTIYDLIPTEHIPAIKHYQNTRGFYKDVPLIPQANHAIPELTTKYDIFIVSAALEFPNSLPDRFDFIGDHFPMIPWNNIVFCGNKQIVKADYIIDDMLENINSYSTKGFLFSAYHNIGIEHENRVEDWEHAIKLLEFIK